MRKIHLYLSVIFLSMLLIQCDSHDRALNKRLNEMALNLNESAPVMLDQYTRFEEAIVSSKNVFIYRYTVLNTSKPDSLIDGVEQLLKDNIKAEFATNPELSVFKENNVVIEYVYNDINDETIRILRIDPEDYK